MRLLKLIYTTTRFQCTKVTNAAKMKYLNVAEKNDAAKNIASQLSNGNSHRVKYTLSLSLCCLDFGRL